MVFRDPAKLTLLHALYSETPPPPGFGLRVVRDKGLADKPAGPPRPPRQPKKVGYWVGGVGDNGDME